MLDVNIASQANQSTATTWLQLLCCSNPKNVHGLLTLLHATAVATAVTTAAATAASTVMFACGYLCRSSAASTTATATTTITTSTACTAATTVTKVMVGRTWQ
eukprot:12991188-Ditylum_brightwellii.AAC.1